MTESEHRGSVVARTQRDPRNVRLRGLRATLCVALVVALAFGLIGCSSGSRKATSPNATPRSLSGRYDVKGTNPDGHHYSGTVSVAGAGPTYTVAWKIAGQTFDGKGTLSGSTFRVRYQDTPSQSGTATYKRQSDGRLIGTWQVVGTSGVGTETWVPK